MNGRHSTAHQFFDRIKSSPNPVAFIKGLVNRESPVFEGEWLEFKGATSLKSSANEKSIREIWAKSLSAFANTEGGVLVWGIDARKDRVSDVDFASDLSPCSNPAWLKSRLLELHHDATDPPVGGVEIEHFADPFDDGAGFVVCLIPESGFKPHRAEQVKNKPYYIRAGDDFVIPSPALLRQLFFPHTHSFLWVEVAADWNASITTGEWGDAQEHAEVTFKVRLHNSGTATAREVYVVVQINPGLDVRRVYDDWSVRSSPQGALAYEAKRPFHPGAVSELIDCSMAAGVSTVHHSGLQTVIPDSGDVHLRFLMYAADREPQVAAVTFNQEEVVGKAAKPGTVQPANWHRFVPEG